MRGLVSDSCAETYRLPRPRPAPASSRVPGRAAGLNPPPQSSMHVVGAAVPGRTSGTRGIRCGEDVRLDRVLAEVSCHRCRACILPGTGSAGYLCSLSEICARFEPVPPASTAISLPCSNRYLSAFGRTPGAGSLALAPPQAAAAVEAAQRRARSARVTAETVRYAISFGKSGRGDAGAGRRATRSRRGRPASSDWTAQNPRSAAPGWCRRRCRACRLSARPRGE